jgi:hypothetical protein
MNLFMYGKSAVRFPAQLWFVVQARQERKGVEKRDQIELAPADIFCKFA